MSHIVIGTYNPFNGMTNQIKVNGSGKLESGEIHKICMMTVDTVGTQLYNHLGESELFF
mgnify:CR=1 FL=1